MNILAVTLVAFSAFPWVIPMAAETDLTEAKALFFDRKYEESRTRVGGDRFFEEPGE